MNAPQQETCGYVNSDGVRCRGRFGLDETGRCFAHSELPERVEKRTRARSRGGKSAATARSKVKTVNPEEAPAPPETIEDAVRWLSWITWATTTGKVDARTGHEAAYALRAFLDGRKVLDRTDERLKELDEKLAQLREPRKKRA